MWSFSYVGRGCADQGEARVVEEITAAAERQIMQTPERAHKHIRAARDFVEALSKTSNAQVSIVAEGWVEEDGLASVTVNVSLSPEKAEAGAASG